MTEQTVAKVPRIRFKGFANEWGNKRVDAIAPLQRGFDLPTLKVKPGRHPVVYSNGVLRFHSEYKCEAPGVVTGRSGTIGKVTFVSANYWPHNTSLWVTNFFHNDPLFIYYFYVNFRLERFNAGSTIPTLNRNDVHAINASIPTPAEQTQIGNYFRELDGLIGLHQRKHDKLVTLKKAMLQKMFPQPATTTPEIRFKGFSGDWASNRIDEIAPLQRGFDLPTTTVRRGPYPVVYSNGILRAHDEYKCVAPGVVTGRSGTIGKVTFVSESYWPHNTSLWVTSFFNNDPLFIYYFYVQFRLDRFNAGSTIPTLNRNDVHAVSTRIPCPAEQQKIGIYFRTLDTLITQHATQLQKLQQLKSACLEKMFV